MTVTYAHACINIVQMGGCSSGYKYAMNFNLSYMGTVLALPWYNTVHFQMKLTFPSRLQTFWSISLYKRKNARALRVTIHAQYTGRGIPIRCPPIYIKLIPRKALGGNTFASLPRKKDTIRVVDIYRQAHWGMRCGILNSL